MLLSITARVLTLHLEALAPIYIRPRISVYIISKYVRVNVPRPPDTMKRVRNEMRDTY